MNKWIILGLVMILSIFSFSIFYVFFKPYFSEHEGLSIPSGPDCKDLLIYSKNFSNPAKAGIQIGFKLRYPSNWSRLEWMEIDTGDEINIYLTPSSEKSYSQPNHIVAVRAKLPTPSEPQTLEEMTNFLLQDCKEVLEISNTSFKGIPAVRLKCSSEEDEGIFLAFCFYFVNKVRVQGIELPVIYQIAYFSKPESYENFVDEVNKMIECFEIV